MDATPIAAGELIAAVAPSRPLAGGTGIVPRVGVSVRAGTLADVPWIDALQKAQGRELGFLPLMAIEGKIRLGQVLVAEAGVESGKWRVESEDGGSGPQASVPSADSPLSTCNSPLRHPVGYLIAADRYYKRDEIGCVTQMNVRAEYRRSLVAATLLQAQFDRCAYGCRLFSCWCAQDLKANAFWEAMGFTPIAFRTGSRTKGTTGAGRNGSARIHLFWQKRVRAGDTTTPWWYPAKTEGGEMREDRLVFPIPPGTHWRDVLPVVLPETANAMVNATAVEPCRAGFNPPADETALSRRVEARPTKASGSRAAKTVVAELPLTAEQIAKRDADRAAARERIRERVRLDPPRPVRPAHIQKCRMWAAPDYDDYQPTDAEIDAEMASRVAATAKAKRSKKAPTATERKIDPRLLAMARELRDRWSEQADAIAALPGKHDVRRALPTAGTDRATLLTVEPLRALPAAA